MLHKVSVHVNYVAFGQGHRGHGAAGTDSAVGYKEAASQHTTLSQHKLMQAHLKRSDCP